MNTRKTYENENTHKNWLEIQIKENSHHETHILYAILSYI